MQRIAGARVDALPTLGDRLKRVVVIGTSGSGKSTFAAKLASLIGVPRFELDELYWGPNWTSQPAEKFRQLVAAAAGSPQWVIAGNYSVVRDLVWPRATTIVWLNYSFSLTLARALRRTVRRAVTREELFGGNRESIRLSFFSRNSVLVWVFKTFWRNRQTYRKLRGDGEYPQLEWLEFCSPDEAENFLRLVGSERGRETTPAELTPPAPAESKVEVR